MDESSLILADDGEHIGHAILRFAEARDSAPALALRFPDGSTLGADGRRGRGFHLFATEAIDGLPCRDVRLGPEVTAHVREAEFVTFLDAAGTALGTVIWEGVRPPPVAGTGLRLAGSGAARRRPATGQSVIPGRTSAGAPRTVKLPRAGLLPIPDATSGPTLPDPPPDARPDIRPDPRPTETRTSPPEPAPSERRRALAAPLLLLAAFALGVVGCVLAGLIGWRLEPVSVAFSGQVGGPFEPARQQVRMLVAWYAKPFLRAAPVPAGSIPDWLALEQTRTGQGWTIDVSPAVSARDLAAGEIAASLPIAFPLRRIREAVRVVLDVRPPDPEPPRARQPQPQPPETQPRRTEAPQARPPRVEPRPAPAPAATINDALCDRLAGNRFDRDHPAGAPYTDEIFELSQADLDAGLVACDPNPARTGADRRFGVQRGRLLAHRALLRLAAGDVSGATADMNAAVALWHHGDELESSYAANLLGAYSEGTFNRPGHAFVEPDDSAANDFWRKGMEGGNIVAQRNYAAQLLAGKGVTADPARAVALLRNAVDKGELHAAGILGIALFTGQPAGVTADTAAGWPLLVAAQCVDKKAAALLQAEIAAGRKAGSDHRDCR